MAESDSSGLETALLLLNILLAKPRKRYVSAKQIQGMLVDGGKQRDLRSIQRHLELLVQRLDIERDERSKPYDYRWPEDVLVISLQLQRLSKALLLVLAQTELSTQLSAEPSKTMVSFFDQAQAYLGPNPGARTAQRWLRKVRSATKTIKAVSRPLYHERKLQTSDRNEKGIIKKMHLISPWGWPSNGACSIWSAALNAMTTSGVLPCLLSSRPIRRTPRTPTRQPLIWPFTMAQGPFCLWAGERARLQFYMDRGHAALAKVSTYLEF